MSKRITSKRDCTAATTLLIIGEGADDKAFINHIKSLLCHRGSGLKVKVEAGDGGAPGVVITNAIRSFKNSDYDQRVIVLDSDLPPSQEEQGKAEKAGYKIILWAPQSLEGALLDTLGEKVACHETSQALKKRLHPKLSDSHTKSNAYTVLFSKPVLTATKNASVAEVCATLSQIVN